MTGALELRAITHAYDQNPVLRGIDLNIEAGQVVCLLGASGSGKSTLLRIVAGLEPLQGGELMLDGHRLAIPGNDPPPERRQFGMVFQDHALFPHLTIAANVAFGLSGAERKSDNTRVMDLLEQVGLADFADRYPDTLSGGQQQRVALARALAPQPRVVLMDEPFASVDSTLRRQLREDTRRTLRDSGVPSIIVTHDAEEAMELADQIAVIDQGHLVQFDTPAAIWHRPVDRFVAELFGGTDAIQGTCQAGYVQTAFGNIAVATDLSPGTVCKVIARPDAIGVRPAESGSTTLNDLRFRGDGYLLLLSAGGEILRARSETVTGLSVGQTVELSFKQDHVFVFAQDG
ncbi:MAG: ABC transporter ATP-binding protein [Pseudomonadota bacterium]